MKRKIFFPVLMLAYSLNVGASNPINEFILTAQTEVLPITFNDATTTPNAFSSWVEEAQFRFNASVDNRFVFDEHSQAYEIRLKPKAWGQRDAENEILKLHSIQQNNTYNQKLNLALKKRYIVLLNYLEQQHKTLYLLQLTKLLIQEKNLIRSEVMTRQFNATKFLDIESLLQQSKGMANLNLSRLNAIQSQLQLPQDSAESLLANKHASWVINISEIHHHLLEITEIHQSALEIKNFKLKLQVVQAEKQLTQAEQQLGINLLSFEYKDSENDAMSFLLGINIPLGTTFKRAKSQYQLQTAQSQLRDSQNGIKQNLDELQKNIGWLTEEQSLVSIQIMRVRKHLLKAYAQTNPLLMLNLRKEVIEYTKKSVDIQHKVLKLYISYLELSGQLVQLPLRNWLQHETPELISRNGT